MTFRQQGIIAIILLCFVAGCATVGPRQGVFPYATVRMNGISYFTLVEMCEKEGIAWDYDPVSQTVILQKGPKEVKLIVNGDAAVVDRVVQKLSAKVIVKDSVLYAPCDVRGYFQPAVCPFPVPAKKHPGGYLRGVNFVIVDAGHGGKDPGASGRYGLREKEVVLDVAERVKNELSRCGLKVQLTRDDDTFIPLYDRPGFANDKSADLFISIHANANRSRWIQGFEAYYLTEAVDDNARALAAAENAPGEIDAGVFKSQVASVKAMLWDLIMTENRKESYELAQTIGRAVSRRMNLKLLGVKGAPFAVLKGARMPAVLIEIGYISNKEGERDLKDAAYRQRMAQAIAEGIMNFKFYAEGEQRG